MVLVIWLTRVLFVTAITSIICCCSRIYDGLSFCCQLTPVVLNTTVIVCLLSAVSRWCPTVTLDSLICSRTTSMEKAKCAWLSASIPAPTNTTKQLYVNVFTNVCCLMSSVSILCAPCVYSCICCQVCILCAPCVYYCMLFDVVCAFYVHPVFTTVFVVKCAFYVHRVFTTVFVVVCAFYVHRVFTTVWCLVCILCALCVYYCLMSGVHIMCTVCFLQ